MIRSTLFIFTALCVICVMWVARNGSVMGKRIYVGGLGGGGGGGRVDSKQGVG